MSSTINNDTCPGCGAEHGIKHQMLPSRETWTGYAAYLCGTPKGQPSSPECLMRQRDQLRAKLEEAEREAERLKKRVAELEAEAVTDAAKLSDVYRWISRNHPDGFVDSLGYRDNLEKISERHWEQLESLCAENEQLQKRLEELETI